MKHLKFDERFQAVKTDGNKLSKGFKTDPVTTYEQAVKDGKEYCGLYGWESFRIDKFFIVVKEKVKVKSDKDK